MIFLSVDNLNELLVRVNLGQSAGVRSGNHIRADANISRRAELEPDQNLSI